MSVLLWALQVLIAMFCIMGSLWRFFNYEQAVNDVASLGALSQGMWNAIGAFEIVCALGLILPGAFNMKPSLTPIAAACLTAEMLLISALHINFFGFQLQPSNPAMWTVMLSIMAAFVAYGRKELLMGSRAP